jgi:hypothetical protein
MKVMFLDESGDHNLKKISPNYPVFVLGGVIVDRAYVRNEIEPRMRQFKQRFFGRDDVILHTVDMGRGGGDYAFLDDPHQRSRFYIELNEMLSELDYKVVACVIKKGAHFAQYGANAADPYMYGLEILIERFCKELGTELDAGFICAEKRNPTLDRELLRAWEELRTGGIGTGFTSSRHIEERIIGLDLRDKKPNLTGMQLADLVITPVGRHILGKPQKADQVQWTVVESKLRRYNGRYMGAGLVIRPRGA